MSKETTIEHALKTGSLDAMKTPMIRKLEAQGHRFAPMEVASLVHEEASYPSRELQWPLQERFLSFDLSSMQREW